MVDGLCAYAMFSRFIPADNSVTAVLIYNFCAFALQMPPGVLLDRLPLKRKQAGMLCALAGVAITFAGVLLPLTPALPGLGNALFHIGAGTAVIRGERTAGRLCRSMGAFVAPGAAGLFLGKLLAEAPACAVLPAAAPLLLIPGLILFIRRGKEDAPESAVPRTGSGGAGRDLPVIVLCFGVVVLRSFTGLIVHFSAASGTVFSLICALAVAGGKWLGGVLGARCGPRRTAVLSLCGAAVLYILSVFSAAAAVAALLLFNMTMPLTLYEPVRRRPEDAGFLFGLLTFGLFLGFVPVQAGLTLPFRSEFAGAACCILSLALLLPVFRKKEGKACIT